MQKIGVFFSLLKCPSDFIDSVKGKEDIKIAPLSYGIVYLLLGALLNTLWHFPWFWEFTICFVFIGSLGAWAIYYFSIKMASIIGGLSNQPPAINAKHVYSNHFYNSSTYIIVPLVTIVIFGVGGCSMFGAITFTPTLIWVLCLFFIVVYISMVGYISYIALASYICNLAHGKGEYKQLPKEEVGYIPAKIDWLQTLTKLSHAYRAIFFTLGNAFIIAFGSFCWLPGFNANTASPVFYLLWLIIFFAIVVVFPVVSIMEYKWIKQIVSQLKRSFISDLNSENNIAENLKPNNSSTEDSTVSNPTVDNLAIAKPAIANLSPEKPSSADHQSSLQQLFKMHGTTQIINSLDYPIKSGWATLYAGVLAILNFAATLLTIMQGISMLSSVIPQFL